MPIPPIPRLHFWNSNILTQLSFLQPVGPIFGKVVALALSISLFLTCIYLFRKQPAVRNFYIVGTLTIGLFQVFIHENPAIRHSGHLFIVFILCAWLYLDLDAPAHRIQPAHKNRRLLSLFLTAILSTQTIAGIYAISVDYLYPFSAGKEAATFLRDNNLDTALIVGDRYDYTSVVSGYLNVPIYYIDREELGTFWIVSPPKRREDTRQDMAIEATITQIKTTPSKTLVLLLSKPINFVSQLTKNDIDVTQLATFEQNIVEEEKLYVYLAQHIPTTIKTE
ncbi:MAG: hypothetical protein AAFZ17_12995 [Cyanobacteria bacterium J06650_10]